MRMDGIGVLLMESKKTRIGKWWKLYPRCLQCQEVRSMTEHDKEEIARTIVRLLRENPEVRSTVMNLVCSCPNVAMKY